MKVSSFQSATRPAFYIESAPPDRQYVHFSFKNVKIESIFIAIKKQSWLEKINHAKTKRGGWDANKKHIPCFTPSGTFRIRCDWDLIDYSGIVVLDYDKVEKPDKLRDRLWESPFCMASFISPGGHGVKAFVRVNTSANHHASAWTQVREMFDALAGIKSDPSGRNLSRLCFVSSDVDCHYNLESKVFEVAEVKTSVTIPDISILASDSNSVFGYLYNLTTKGKYQTEVLGDYGSQRNNFLYVFACNCNRYGIDQQTAFEFVKSIWVQNNMGFTTAELTKTVVSAYGHKHEFATFRLPKNLK